MTYLRSIHRRFEGLIFSPFRSKTNAKKSGSHIVEETEHGVAKVVRKYGAQAYDFGTSTIIVTIPFDRSGFEKEDVPVNVPVNVPVKQTNEDKIVEAIKMNSHVTMNKMARIIGKTRKTLL